jgi:PAS domain S-box-containing protein
MTIRARILLIVLTLMFIAVGGYYMLIGVMDTSSLGLVQNLSASWMALSMFMLAVVLYRVLGSRVIARLSELNKQAHQLKISVHTDEHIRVSGNDEIADLASTLNETFERLASARYALKDAADEWLTTFNAISDPIAIQDADFRILRVNDAYLRLVNKPADEVIGQLCFHIIHQCDAPVAACPHARTLQSGQLEYNITYEAALGRHFEALTFPIFDDQHRVKATVHMLKDISARRAAEEEQKQLRDKAEIHSRLAAVGEMAAGIAHEINNPLTGVIGFSDLLMNRPDLPGIIREELKIINDGSLRAGLFSAIKADAVFS